MKRLILIRHAKSSQDDPTLADRVRPLNARGLQDASRMGQALRDFGPPPQSLYTSTAVRAATTARLIAEGLGFDAAAIISEESLYTFDERGLMSAVHAFPDEDTCVAVVGHNPACHCFFEALLGQRLDDYVTCGTAIIECDVMRWREVRPSTGRLVQFLLPRLLV